MNQFLLGLVERATQRAPVLERRPRSLFEPNAPAVGGPAAIEGDEPAEPEALDGPMALIRHGDASSGSRSEPATDGGWAERTARSERAVVAAPVAGPLEPVARFAPTPAAQTLSAETPHEPGNVAAAAPNTARRASDEPPVASAAPPSRRELEPARLEAAHATTQPAKRPRRDPGPHTRMLAPAPMHPSSPAHGGDASHRVPRAPSPRPATAGSSIAVPVPTTNAGSPAANVPLLRSGPRVPGPPALLVQSQGGSRGGRTDGTTAAAPAPVHVTIGRIEVRANPPAAERPPVRRQPAGPKLSLDDYLSGRRGGSR